MLPIDTPVESADTSLNDFTGTYLAKIRVPLNAIVHLLYLFSLGVPAYRIRFYAGISLKTIEHTFRIFREAIYDSSMVNPRLSGKPGTR